MGRFFNSFISISQRIGAMKTAPASSQIQLALFGFGVLLLTGGIVSGANAVDFSDPVASVDQTRFTEAVDIILTYIQGSFGALVMVCAGLGAILSSAFGQYRAALGLLVVAVGSFILTSLVRTFFDVDNSQVLCEDGVDC